MCIVSHCVSLFSSSILANSTHSLQDYLLILGHLYDYPGASQITLKGIDTWKRLINNKVIQ